uniref:Myb/SANT-like domain-containing protein n=1 Tax=Arundo donax TaxID=35708 RepID=A0A0A9E826_ARUDO
MEGGREFGEDGLADLFSQADPTAPDSSNAACFDFFSQPAVNSMMGRGVPSRRGSMEALDLNLQVGEFPHLSSYQDFLQSGIVAEVPGGYRGNAGRRPDKSSNGVTPYRAPRSAVARTKGRRGGSLSVGDARSGAPRGSVADAGCGTQPRGSTATGGTSVPRGPSAAGGTSGPRGPAAAGGTSGPRAYIAVGGGIGGPRGSAAGADGSGADGALSEPADGGDGTEEQDEAPAHDPLMAEPYDKANWSSENTFVFCDICCEEIRAGNISKGFMTNRGYKNIAEKYELSVRLQHSRKQLKNRWQQLKGLYAFWLWLNTKTGFGRANGTVVADNEFWKEHTKKKKPEWKKLRYGPPEWTEIPLTSPIGDVR